MERYIQKECKTHGMSKFILENRGYYRCVECRKMHVIKRRKKVKQILVAEHGGKCILCGYSKYIGALEFHHLDPSTKTRGLSERGLTLAIDKLREEADKCVLLCANCHAEVESNPSILGSSAEERNSVKVTVVGSIPTPGAMRGSMF